MRLDWPECIPETFEQAIAALPNATAGGDEDGNGVPNIMQWMMGKSMQSAYIWRDHPACSRPFVDVQNGQIQFVIPPIERGWNHQVDVMVSTDCKNWVKAENVQWQQVRRHRFYNEDRSASVSIDVQPLTIFPTNQTDVLFMRLRIR